MKRPRITITALIALSAVLCVQKDVIAVGSNTPLQKQIKVQFAFADQLAQLRGMGLDIRSSQAVDHNKKVYFSRHEGRV